MIARLSADGAYADSIERVLHVTGTSDVHECVGPHTLGGILEQAVAMEASDVHLVPGYTPAYRVHGRIQHGEG